jgi:hypothetical protein
MELNWIMMVRFTCVERDVCLSVAAERCVKVEENDQPPMAQLTDSELAARQENLKRGADLHLLVTLLAGYQRREQFFVFSSQKI